jgi:hypothetical protein
MTTMRTFQVEQRKLLGWSNVSLQLDLDALALNVFTASGSVATFPLFALRLRETKIDPFLLHVFVSEISSDSAVYGGGRHTSKTWAFDSEWEREEFVNLVSDMQETVPDVAALFRNLAPGDAQCIIPKDIQAHLTAHNTEITQADAEAMSLFLTQTPDVRPFTFSQFYEFFW